ncbi:MAG TPA: hypothetical protein PLF32_08365 [Bacteroidales bacterium]|jgi:hypothetical protein|nr:hypothetical protein [Bacteroidales bacterium]HOF16813.1 hypothetical protein [Bacteroidales bacterium]HOR82655.1 hypothetical protein [Bacteroidales bacterium]HPJ91846.1 hypothetical protein [Bacteroidales bacterium]
MKISFVEVIIFVVSALCSIQAQDVFIKKQKHDTTKKIHLESFSDLPDEIDGCSCYFSISQEDLESERYIFVNDFAALAFVKIEGKLIRFELQNHDEKRNIYYYIHNDDTMKVEIIKKITNKDEAVVIQGLITISTVKGCIKQKFTGECGC